MRPMKRVVYGDAIQDDGGVSGAQCVALHELFKKGAEAVAGLGLAFTNRRRFIGDRGQAIAERASS
jgi:hypothetical protein